MSIYRYVLIRYEQLLLTYTLCVILHCQIGKARVLSYVTEEEIDRGETKDGGNERRKYLGGRIGRMG